LGVIVGFGQPVQNTLLAPSKSMAFSKGFIWACDGFSFVIPLILADMIHFPDVKMKELLNGFSIPDFWLFAFAAL
jgi:hypothetical protein